MPLFVCCVPAGFPSPANDYIDEFLDLNKKLIINKSATFLARAEGNSILGTGNFSGDLLIIEPGSPRHARIVEHRREYGYYATG